MRRSYLIVLVLFISLVGVGIYIVTRPYQKPVASVSSTQQVEVPKCTYNESDVLNRINSLRTNKLLIVRVYDDFAESRIPEVRADFSHTGYRLRMNSLPTGRLTGEILAKNSCGTQLINGWLNSPTHKAVLMDESYDSVGIAGDNTYTVVIFGDLR